MKDFCQIDQVEVHVMMSLQVDLHDGDEIDWRSVCIQDGLYRLNGFYLSILGVDRILVNTKYFKVNFYQI